MKGRHDPERRKPWYLVIGPAGAGKSSMLANCGLAFQEAPAIAPDLLAASGDLVSFWEADDAVFLECAGRLVGAATGDADEAAWIGLLKLLKRRRSRQPLAGAIVAAALDAPASDVEAAMRRTRKRIAQIDAQLGVRLPVYVVVTKADSLPGFASYFGALTPSQRDQVWGVTLPLRDGAAEANGASERLGQAIDALGERLSQSLLASLHEEDDPRRSAEIFAFPRRFAGLTTRLRAIVEALGADSRAQPAARLRGLYLTAAPDFFLKRLFAEVILVEDALVTIGAGGGAEQRRLRQIGAALAAIVAIVFLVFLAFAFSDQSAFLAAARARLAAYSDRAAGLPAQDVADSDLGRAAQAIAALKDEDAPRLHLGALSLDRSAEVASAWRDLAIRARGGLLLPRILVALQRDMAGRAGTQARDDARVYLMLGGQSPLDRAFAGRTLAGLYERDAPLDERAPLGAETTALLAGPLAPIALDPIVSQDARALASP